MGRTCGQCEHFIGFGDWDLCCKAQARRLTYNSDFACGKFRQNTACINVSSKVGWFYCSICGEESAGKACEGMRCPSCGSEIEGAIFGGQLGWRGE